MHARAIGSNLSLMDAEHRAVGQHYDENILDFELERLGKHSPVEFLMTSRAFAKWLPARPGIAVDIGVGSGAYACHLASAGFRLHLADVSEKLLDAAVSRLEDCGLGSRVESVSVGSITNLESLPDGCASVALALGPFYHLRSVRDRNRGVDEILRILEPRGVLFAAGINRMAFLRDTFREQPVGSAGRLERYRQFLLDGLLDPQTAPPIGYAHLTTPEGFRSLFPAFEELALLGLESFTSPNQTILAGLNEDDKAAWLELVERTSSAPDGLGYADHFLYVGQASSG